MITLYTLKSIWASVKKYWQLLLLVLGVVIGFFLFRNNQSALADSLKKIQDAHAKELEAIEAARAAEIKQRDENIKRLSVALSEIQKQYDAQKLQLDNKKKKEIEQIVKDYSNKPEELAKKLSEVAGFTVILPS